MHSLKPLARAASSQAETANLLGVARHQGVIAIEQNGAFAVGPQGIKVDAID